ncbi:MAG: hypothetical protein AAB480_02655 [Patescibacteria group bacterium]
MEHVVPVLYTLAIYLLFAKVWPYCLYPNYFLPSKIEQYPELTGLASGLRGNDKLQTVENVYAYIQRTYTGHADVFKIKSALSVFKLGDFSTKELPNKKQFLWCHTQNRLLKSILVNTGAFQESEILIQRRLFFSLFIHQWLALDVEGKKMKIDPYYGIFEVR